MLMNLWIIRRIMKLMPSQACLNRGEGSLEEEMVEDVEKRMEASDTCTSLGNSGLRRMVSCMEVIDDG